MCGGMSLPGSALSVSMCECNLRQPHMAMMSCSLCQGSMAISATWCLRAEWRIEAAWSGKVDSDNLELRAVIPQLQNQLV